MPCWLSSRANSSCVKISRVRMTFRIWPCRKLLFIHCRRTPQLCHSLFRFLERLADRPGSRSPRSLTTLHPLGWPQEPHHVPLKFRCEFFKRFSRPLSRLFLCLHALEL